MRLVIESKYPHPFKEKHTSDSEIIYESGQRTSDMSKLKDKFDEYVEETEGEKPEPDESDGEGTSVLLDIETHHNVQPKTDGTYPTQYNYDKKVLSHYTEAVANFKPSATDVLNIARSLRSATVRTQLRAMLFTDSAWLGEICDIVTEGRK